MFSTSLDYRDVRTRVYMNQLLILLLCRACPAVFGVLVEDIYVCTAVEHIKARNHVVFLDHADFLGASLPSGIGPWMHPDSEPFRGFGPWCLESTSRP